MTIKTSLPQDCLDVVVGFMKPTSSIIDVAEQKATWFLAAGTKFPCNQDFASHMNLLGQQPLLSMDFAPNGSLSRRAEDVADFIERVTEGRARVGNILTIEVRQARAPYKGPHQKVFARISARDFADIAAAIAPPATVSRGSGFKR